MRTKGSRIRKKRNKLIHRPEEELNLKSECILVSTQRRLDTLTDLHGTPCHVWLVNIARSTWRRLSKCVFVLFFFFFFFFFFFLYIKILL